MTANSLSEMCRAIAPALGNHLWQSTVFAIAAGLLTLSLWSNQARTRYLLWLTASVKFLIPFSLLAAIGSHIAWWRGSGRPNGGIYIAADQLSQPFSPSGLPLISETAPATHSAGVIDLLPALLAEVWLCGIALVVLAWYVRWRRVSAVMRNAVSLREGREVETLRRLECVAGTAQQIEVWVSRTSLEPGIFGIVRPTLVWPHGLSERLGGQHLESILAHELCHVRRRDNLSAALHMAVEAIFWFHPMVWWLGARLLEERERACDEQVLEWGSDRQIYAESILKICEFCVGSSLDVVSGVTGADLKKRIAHIMRKNVIRKLDLGRKLLLSVAGLTAFAVPIVFGLLRAPQIRADALHRTGAPSLYFEVTAVQPSPPRNDGTIVRFIPGKLTLANWTTKALIVYAYGTDQISGGPAWINSQRYDIDANVDDALAYDAGKLMVFNVAGRFPPGLRHDQLRLALKSMLADRFNLRLSHEIKQVPTYELVIAKNGPKLHEAKPGDSYANGIVGLDGLPAGPHRGAGQNGRLTAQALPMSNVAMTLSQQLNCTVLDKTGLPGDYDFTLAWTPDENPMATSGQPGVESPVPPGPSGASIFTAIEEQLGLRLELQEVSTEFLLIKSVEKPVEPQALDTAAAAPAFGATRIKPNTTDTPMAGFSISGKALSAAMFKPDRFMATNFTLHQLIRLAYGIQDSQILSEPEWLNSKKYDVDAKIDSSVVDELNRLGKDQGNLERLHMLQALLADHFKLTFHQDRPQRKL
jgi:bla regulator protein blaR1